MGRGQSSRRNDLFKTLQKGKREQREWEDEIQRNVENKRRKSAPKVEIKTYISNEGKTYKNKNDLLGGGGAEQTHMEGLTNEEDENEKARN